MVLLRRSLAWVGLPLLAVAACDAPPQAELDTSDSLYALQESADGVALLPPLGPGASSAGSFDSSLLAGLSIAVESEDASGASTVVATFDRSTQPAVSRIDAREMYFLDLPAAAYLTDASRTYTIRALHDGASIAASTLDARVFAILAANPGFRIGVKVRIDTSAGLASRSTAVSSPCAGGASLSYDQAAEVLSWSAAGTKAALMDPSGATASRATSGSIAHPAVGTWTLEHGSPGCTRAVTTAVVPAPTCTDGYRNQGEEQVDCGGPCVACATCTDGIRNGSETGVDCGGSCPNTCNCPGTFVYWVWVYGGQQQYSRTFHGYARDTHHTSPIPNADCRSRFGIPNVNAIFDQNNHLVDGQYTTNCSNDTPTLTRLSFTPDDPTCR